jgi:hypothetical protein
MKDEALKMAIEALQNISESLTEKQVWFSSDVYEAINACKESLEQPDRPTNVVLVPADKLKDMQRRLKALEQPALTDEKGRPMTYWGGLEQPAQEPLTQEKYEQLKNQSTQWTSSLPMTVHLINKHFGIDDGLDWGQK